MFVFTSSSHNEGNKEGEVENIGHQGGGRERLSEKRVQKEKKEKGVGIDVGRAREEAERV